MNKEMSPTFCDKQTSGFFSVLTFSQPTIPTTHNFPTEEREMQTSIPSLFALTLGTLLMTMQGPAMAQNLQINPAQQPATAAPQAVAAPAGPATAGPAVGGPAATIAPAQAGAVATTTVAAQTAVATTSTTTVATQMNLLPASTVLGTMLQNFNNPQAFNMPGFGGRSRCGHVISMLMQQHLHNQFFGGNAQNIQQTAPGVMLDPFGRPMLMNRLGDLRLVSVQMVADATPETGPLYEVTLLNDSVRDAVDFRVSLVAVHGGILPNSPTVTMNVDEIAAGGTATLQVQMPQGCLAIAVAGQAAAPFDMLVVAIDSFDELMEGNELNNVAVLERSDIVIVGVTTETAVTTEAVQSTTATPAPPAEDAPAAAAPVDNGQAAPGNGGAVAPDAEDDDDDKLDFDNLGLDNADEAESTFFTGK